MLTYQRRLYVSVTMQIVGKHYCEEASFQVRFEHSEISLDIPNEGKVTEEGWRIMPSTCPTVSDTELCIQESLLSTFAKNDRSTTPCIHYQ